MILHPSLSLKFPVKMTIKSINTQGVIIKIIPIIPNPKVNGRLIILSIFIRSITMPVPTLPTIKR